jgi:NAD(P)-dependent dehydrogenase (short-subunit alcohol dehydrogenase family)
MGLSHETRGAAIITGGGRGIGRAITLRLARELPVVAVGRTLSDLEAVCDEVTHCGGMAAVCPGDISDVETAARAVHLVQSEGWTVGHLICNAGIGKGGATESVAFDAWRQTFDVNVHGCFHFVQACLPLLLERGAGTICIMSSMAGVVGVPYDAAYTASKHALVGFARSLALEYGKRGINVTALCPSFVESDMTRRTIRGVMRRRGISEAEAERRVAEKSPAKRILPVEEVAETVALLVAGDFAEAAVLAARGGYPLVGGRS